MQRTYLSDGTLVTTTQDLERLSYETTAFDSRGLVLETTRTSEVETAQAAHQEMCARFSARIGGAR